ncbi:CidB/LrgB family autolysis modulator [Aliivibrio sp. S3MY1]|uniref:CidB/LrgB family autolysis modulator n=1 Tax=unclassified Aliivibrio TaxID=2645654 RepID=UPI002379A6D1|nr:MULTISPECIES: CidB/LrgB family autolysis modulator [unclassified Aliivibrio]MDD9197351.1 CidB/LrgB family autolysis modulator [Aliivibrio sp. S3MY1]MDD9200569.1 CidB/LrgB family autolysis modulator [Aliivibrio sp. S2MY1]
MWVILTVIVFYSARWFAKRFPHPINNPLLLSVFIVIPILMVLQVPYDTYYADNAFLSYLLQPAVVALAYPLYEQLPHIRENWKIILLACSVGSLFSMLSGAFLAVWMGADMQLVASILPKSVTTPIAMAISSQLEGEAAIAAILVLLAGLMGAICAYPIYNMLGIKSSLARGLTMGNVSHALGTAQAAEVDSQDAAFSSLALVICGIITSLVAPLIYSLLVFIKG